ncbi:hypothetical protein D5086_001210 [Populus alba]|uniref:Uncharacterized protein n=1 Tax=Populus alba TaxID=43335 RepID=A0ACC4CY96_POPAL
MLLVSWILQSLLSPLRSLSLKVMTKRVRDLLDFSIYLDISNEVKFAWKIQRDMAERGHSLESIKASIEARKPDFDAYIGSAISWIPCGRKLTCSYPGIKFSYGPDTYYGHEVTGLKF